jgi:hypothetical protein
MRMGWIPELETVVQLSPEERNLFEDGDPSSVLHRYQLPERKGINRGYAARKVDQSAARKVVHLQGGSFYAFLI